MGDGHTELTGLFLQEEQAIFEPEGLEGPRSQIRGDELLSHGAS